jgi:hypothetical protein
VTALEFVRLVLLEFRARGWDAVLHGPEAHLALPLAGGLILAAAIAAIIWRKL